VRKVNNYHPRTHFPITSLTHSIRPVLHTSHPSSSSSSSLTLSLLPRPVHSLLRSFNLLPGPARLSSTALLILGKERGRSEATAPSPAPHTIVITASTKDTDNRHASRHSFDFKELLSSLPPLTMSAPAPWYSSVPIPEFNTPIARYDFKNKELEQLLYASVVHERSFASSLEQRDTFEALTWVGSSVLRGLATVLLASMFPTSRKKVLNVNFPTSLQFTYDSCVTRISSIH